MSLFKNTRFEPFNDSQNLFSLGFKIGEAVCYIEPGFMALLRAIEEREPHHLTTILDEMATLVQTEKKVVFALDFDSPITLGIDDFIVLELQDILNRVHIFFDSVNTGSNLGD